MLYPTMNSSYPFENIMANKMLSNSRKADENHRKNLSAPNDVHSTNRSQLLCSGGHLGELNDRRIRCSNSTPTPGTPYVQTQIDSLGNFLQETEYDNLALGRFMDPGSKLWDSKLISRHRFPDTARSPLPSSKKNLPEIRCYSKQSAFEDNSTNNSNVYNCRLKNPVVEPLCIKRNIYDLECRPQDDYAKEVMNEHGGIMCKSDEPESLMDNLEEALKQFLKEVIGEDPNKTDKQPEENNFNAQKVPEASYIQNCEQFVAPQQRAPRSACRYGGRDSVKLSNSSLGQNELVWSNSGSCQINPSYTVTEWLTPEGASNMSPNQSLRSSLTISSIRRGKKRALSSSPLSTDGIDLNAVIRTSPTSLVSYINGSRSSSASLSPALGHPSDLTGYCGHLSARTSPFTSRSGSSQRRASLLSPIGNIRGQLDIASILSLEQEPIMYPEEMSTLANQSIQTLQNNLQMLNNHCLGNERKCLQSCMYPRCDHQQAAIKPPPSYSEHIAEKLKRCQHKLKPLKAENAENEGPISDKYREYICLWMDCNGKFVDQQSLVKHIEKNHVDQKKGDEFTCFWQNCSRKGRPFNARYKLLIHMRVHSGEKPNKCPYDGCSKAFSRLENLKIHERSHTGEKPYICQHPDCMKRFSNSSDRAKHQRTHLDTKPYACQVVGCTKRYTDPSSLRKHVKNHQKDCQTKKKAKSEDNNESFGHNRSPGKMEMNARHASDLQLVKGPKEHQTVRRIPADKNLEMYMQKTFSSDSNQKSCYLPPISQRTPKYNIPVLQGFCDMNLYGNSKNLQVPSFSNEDKARFHL